MRESVQPACLQALEPRRRERLGRHLERELGEDQHAQGPPRHVNALPERIRSQENPRARFAKPPQQVITLPLALDEQRPPPADRVAHGFGGTAQGRVAREQHEHPPVGRVGQLDQHARHGGAVSGFVIARLRQVGRDPEHALRREVERRRVDLAHLDARGRQVEPQPLLEKAEVAAGGERGAREHHGLDAIEQVVLEDGREVERHGRERDVRRLATSPLDPAHRRGPARRRPQRDGQARGRRVEPPPHAA